VARKRGRLGGVPETIACVSIGFRQQSGTEPESRKVPQPRIKEKKGRDPNYKKNGGAFLKVAAERNVVRATQRNPP